MTAFFGTENMLRILVVFTILYALWVMYYTIYGDRKEKKKKTGSESVPSPEPEKKGKSLMGKSKFILERSQSQPQAATPEKEADNAENSNTFVPSIVPEHPKQVPKEELDETFNNAVPDDNPPLDINYPLSRYEDSTVAADDEDEEESEYLPNTGRQSLADGVSFEQMGDAFRTVVQNPKQTRKEKVETGRVLVHLKHTDMFEAVVSGNLEREDKVACMMNSYLTAFHKKQAALSGEDDVQKGKVPSDFDMRKFM
jgi:hypothetical protein